MGHYGRLARLSLLATALLLAAACTVVRASEDAPAGDAAAKDPASAVDRLVLLVKRFPVEAALIATLVVYVLAVMLGRTENLKLATEWSQAFAEPENSLLAQQFAIHGSTRQTNGKLFWRDGPSTFKFWATGRRNCVGVLFTVETPPHHDIVRRLVPGQSDGRLEVEVWMTEATMPPMVLAVAPPKVLKLLSKSNPDLKDFAKKVEVAKDKMPLWPTSTAPSPSSSGIKDLGVLSESAGLFYDLFGEPRVQQLIAKDPNLGKHLRSLVVSSEGSLGRPPHKMLFTFGLPGPGAMGELQPCLALAFMLIDIVGGYRLSADAQTKAQALRQKVEASREERKAQEEGGGGGGANAHAERQEAAMRRRMEKLLEEKEKARRQGPKALEKFEERMRKQSMKKQMKKSTVKMG